MSGYHLLILICMLSISWLTALVFSPIVVKIANRFRILDPPSERKIHDRPIPRIGGVAIVVSFAIPFALFYSSICFLLHLPIWHIFQKPQWFGLLAGALTVFFVGLVDDVKGLPPVVKLFFQIVAVTFVCLGGLTIKALYIPFFGYVALSFLAFPVTLMWFLLIINGFNLIDGMDGLAATVAFMCSFFLLVFCLQNGRFFLALPAVIITGSTLGFLHFNINPARLFMGDSGSYFLGFNLAALALKASRLENGHTNLIVPAIILLLPIVDSVLAVLRRIVHNRPIFHPDRDHIHHCLLRKGLCQNEALVVLTVVIAITGCVGLLIGSLSDLPGMLLLCGLFAFLAIVAYKVGYLDCFVGINLTATLVREFRALRIRLNLFRLEFVMEDPGELKFVLSKLARVFRQLDLDYAVLVVENDPRSGDDRLCVAVQNEKGVEKAISKDGLLSIRLPLVVENGIRGVLYVEKSLVNSALDSAFIFGVVDKAGKIIARRLKKQRKLESLTGYPEKVKKKQTFVLIARRTCSQPT